jgi:uncharacterized protein YbaR (Trm112 family)
MLERALDYYRCPRCASALHANGAPEKGAVEIATATLACEGCGAEHPVREGIAYLLPDDSAPSEVKLREREGWRRLADENRNSPDRDEALRRLPFLEGEGGSLRVERHGGLRRADYRISDADRSRARRWARRLGVERLLRFDPLARLARHFLFHDTGAFRILVGDKPR